MIFSTVIIFTKFNFNNFNMNMKKQIINAIILILAFSGQYFAQFTLTINSPGNGAGTVLVNGVSKTLPHTTDVSLSGTTVTLQAVSAISSNFVNWTGDLTSSIASESILIDSDKVVEVNFTLKQYTISTSSNPTAGSSTAIGGGDIKWWTVNSKSGGSGA